MIWQAHVHIITYNYEIHVNLFINNQISESICTENPSFFLHFSLSFPPLSLSFSLSLSPNI